MLSFMQIPSVLGISSSSIQPASPVRKRVCPLKIGCTVRLVVSHPEANFLALSELLQYAAANPTPETLLSQPLGNVHVIKSVTFVGNSRSSSISAGQLSSKLPIGLLFLACTISPE